MEIGPDDSDYYSEGSVDGIDEPELPYDVNEDEPEAVKAIFDAARRGDVDATKAMLDREAVLLEARRGGPDGDPLLLAAAEWGHFDIVRLLLERGATVDQPGRDGWTALHAAAYRGHETMVDLLLERGADAATPASYGSTTLMLAAGSVSAGPGMVRKLLRLLSGQDINQVNDLSETALFWSCFWGRTDTVRLLLMAGADHTIANENSETPREAALRRGYQECVDMIEVR
jgi:ankyrin repeat protein